MWLGGLAAFFAKDKDGDRGLTPHDLDFLFRLLTEVVPYRCGTPKISCNSLKVATCGRTPFSWDQAPDRITDDDWVGVSSPPGRVEASHGEPLRTLWPAAPKV